MEFEATHNHELYPLWYLIRQYPNRNFNSWADRINNIGIILGHKYYHTSRFESHGTDDVLSWLKDLMSREPKQQVDSKQLQTIVDELVDDMSLNYSNIKPGCTIL